MNPVCFDFLEVLKVSAFVVLYRVVVVEFSCFFFLFFNWGFGFSFVLEVWIEFMGLDSIRVPQLASCAKQTLTTSNKPHQLLLVALLLKFHIKSQFSVSPLSFLFFTRSLLSLCLMLFPPSFYFIFSLDNFP